MDPQQAAPPRDERAAALARVRVQSRAHRLTALAVRQGKLVRGGCEVCGDPTTDAHHDDYDKPLDVRWLCRLHHAARHRAMRMQHRAEHPRLRSTISLSEMTRGEPPDEPLLVYRRNGDGTMTTLGMWIPTWLIDE